MTRLKTQKWLSILLILALVLSLGAAILTSTGRVQAQATIYVPDAYTTIQEAVDNASPGDTIIVSDDTYNENVDVNVQNLTIQSESGPENCIVSALDPNGDVFTVTADNVTIAAFTVQNATGSSAAGIRLDHADYCKILNNRVTNNMHGIYLQYASNNNITGNNSYSNSNGGIRLYYADDNNIKDNNTWDNVYGIILSHSSGNTVEGNNSTDSGNHGIQLGNSSTGNTIKGNTVNGNTWGLELDPSCDDNDIIENTCYNNTNFGIRLDSADNNNVAGNNVTNNQGYGIQLSGSHSNNITSNNASSNGNIGILLSGSSNNNLTGNEANANDNYGISLGSSHNNTVTDNKMTDNNSGIRMSSSSGNNITGNNATNNAYGIYLNSVSGNNIYNNYLSNQYNARDDGSNTWNIEKTPGTNIIGGPYLGGNYWSDYAGTDADSDGLGDEPYEDIMGGSNVDNLPLVYLALNLTSYNITLAADWNLISLPFIPDSTAIADVTAAINDTVAIIWGYSGNSSAWYWYVPGNPANTLSTLEDGFGYWFFMNGPATLEVFAQGAVGLGAPASPYDVFVGWNLIGFTSTTSMSLATYLASIAGAYDIIWGWDAGGQAWLWYVPGNPSSTLTTMDPGFGYWLLGNADGTIVPPT